MQEAKIRKDETNYDIVKKMILMVILSIILLNRSLNNKDSNNYLIIKNNRKNYIRIDDVVELMI